MRVTEGASTRELALFPLRSVLFPGGLLGLKVFEARYLDLMSACLREQRSFGVVAQPTGGDAAAAFESVGTRAELVSADSDRPGILRVRCRGTQRFRVLASRQLDDGLWVAQTEPIADDEPLTPPVALTDTVRGLANMIATLKAQNEAPFLQPYRFDDAAWVANRWCEILPIPQAARQKLMELGDPMVRLQLVDEYLRSKGVVS